VTVLYVLLGVLTAGGIVAGVVLYIRRTGAEANAATAAADDQAERLHAVEAANEAARFAREQEFDARVEAATTPTAAADLLRDAAADVPEADAVPGTGHKPVSGH
jgi:hypothetical protein